MAPKKGSTPEETLRRLEITAGEKGLRFCFITAPVTIDFNIGKPGFENCSQFVITGHGPKRGVFTD